MQLLLLVAWHLLVVTVQAEIMRGLVYNKSAKLGSHSIQMEWTDSIAQPPSGGEPAAGLVLVKVKAFGLNPVDYKIPGIPLVSMGINGKVVGQDFAGIIEAVHPSSTKFKVGDKIFGFASHSLTEKVLASEDHIALKPETASFNEAASLPTVALTSLQALQKGGVKAGSRVLVVGASSGCGLLGVQLARSLVGPEGKVGGVCGTSNVQMVQSLGVCDVVADYKSPAALLDTSSSPLLALQPLDVVYDCVSSSEPGDGLSGESYDKSLAAFFTKDTRVVAINGSAMRWIRSFLGWEEKQFNLILCRRQGAQLDFLRGLVDKKTVVPVLDSTHPFSAEGCAAAYERLSSRRARGKVVVDISGGAER